MEFKKKKKTIQVKIGDLFLAQLSGPGPKIPDKRSTAVMLRMPVCLFFPNRIIYHSHFQVCGRQIKDLLNLGVHNLNGTGQKHLALTES